MNIGHVCARGGWGVREDALEKKGPLCHSLSSRCGATLKCKGFLQLLPRENLQPSSSDLLQTRRRLPGCPLPGRTNCHYSTARSTPSERPSGKGTRERGGHGAGRTQGGAERVTWWPPRGDDGCRRRRSELQTFKCFKREVCERDTNNLKSFQFQQISN